MTARKAQIGSADEPLVARARRELSRGVIELAVLSVLDGRPRYGYELLSQLDEMTGGAPELKEGTLYPVLHRLEDAEYVESYWEAEGRSAPRKYYSLTAAGRQQLELLRSEWKRLVDGMHRLFQRERRER